MNIVGWDKIVPQLATFFSILKRRPNHLTPFNLFLVGNAGTNKTEGIAQLANALGHTASFVDSATLDDVSELAGVVDLKANMQEGASRVISGDLLSAEVLVLDEFLNVRPHVLPQFRLMLQGQLVLFGKKQAMAVKAIIGTGNLQEHMFQGEANHLDSPSADRFAMIVCVPGLSEMSDADVDAILEGRGGEQFEIVLKNAVAGVDQHFAVVEKECGKAATRYVRSLVRQLAGKEFALEGRRAKLLRLFVLGAMALCRAEPERDLHATIWSVVHDCLTYHKLSGVKLDEGKLLAAHATALQLLGDVTVEALIAEAPDLVAKLELLVPHLKEVSAATKADLFGQMLADSPDISIKIACLQLARSARFTSEPAELRALIERVELPRPAGGFKMDARLLARLSMMSRLDLDLFEITQGNDSETERIKEEARRYLTMWGLGAEQLDQELLAKSATA